MRVIDLITNNQTTAFSFEILPPLKGNNIDRVYQTIDLLRPFDPKYINITTHRSEIVYKEVGQNLFKQVAERHRPGTVAIAAAIQNKYKINVVPHVICSGFTKSETEYALIDLQFLGIHDLLVLRGDKAKHEKNFSPSDDGHLHALDLQDQINDFNAGRFLDGTTMERAEPIFSYGVAGYPEKHDEAPNMETDIIWLKEKVRRGAAYVVTQMFFDNERYFSFVERCRTEGINVPIIPGLKPITFMNQLTALPKIFHVDMPEALVLELSKCKTDAAATEVGVEWCIMQAKELKQHGVPSIHFYTLMASHSVKKVAEQVY
jgi:methylenetetrahydrofolate reductase (NADPH)